jgi:glycosyl hydrolase family 28
MPQDDVTNRFSRRQWVGMMSGPVIAAALSAAPVRAAEQGHGNQNDLGVRVYNIREFGAIGDGRTLDTAAIQKAIDTCTNEKGGVVLVPAGTFLTGAIELKSNVTFHISAGATLLASGEGKDYHAVEEIPLTGDSTLGDGNWGLIYATYAKNVTIEGPGLVDGNGKQFLPPVRGQPAPSGLNGNKRPYLLLFYRCENLTIRDIDLFRSGYHCIRVIQSSYGHFDNIHIHNRVAHNNDGFHFISCEHVSISNCKIECQDDACALFGSCKWFTITNCAFMTRWSVFRFGGGLAENITVSNCLMYHVYGCPIKMHGSPGSRFENISFSNLVFDDVTGPINISIGPGGRRSTTAPASTQPPEMPVSREPAIVRNISFSNIKGTVTTDPKSWPDLGFIQNYNPGERFSCITLNCVGNSILENISFDNIHLTFGGGGTAQHAARRELPEIAGEYFFLGEMPAYGFYARNARAITLNNVRLQFAGSELRPALILDNVEDVTINGLNVQGDPQAESVLRFINTKFTLVSSPRVLTKSPVFLRVEGKDSGGIILDGGDLSRASAPTAFVDGANESAVKIRSS